MINKLQQLNDKFAAWQERMQRSVAPPNYFNKHIFRIAFLLIAVLLLVDLHLNNYSARSYYVECPENQLQCINPVHLCSAQPAELTQAQDGGFNMQLYQQVTYSCYKTRADIPANLCPNNICERFYLNPGEKYGRRDVLTEYGDLIILLLILIAFLCNHLYFKKYARKQ
jgi:hypothetical protein